MYFPFFITYILIGFGISGLVFLWALKNGQFSEQRRASFLPLQHDMESPPPTTRGIHRFEAIALLSLACLGLLVSASVLVFSLLQAR
jgi:cbb3-type cytochrome oxidase maturation protein